MASIIIGSSPPVLVYEIQNPALGYRSILNIPPSGFASASSPKTILGVGAASSLPVKLWTRLLPYGPRRSKRRPTHYLRMKRFLGVGLIFNVLKLFAGIVRRHADLDTSIRGITQAYQPE
jgi:hypothetical protein